jgi:hypothetical protein
MNTRLAGGPHTAIFVVWGFKIWPPAPARLRRLKSSSKFPLKPKNGLSGPPASAGKDISASGIYVDTWRKRNGQWQLINSTFP